MILTKENIEKVDIDSMVNDRIKNDKLNEVLFIVPTRRKIRHLTRELISLAPKNAVAGLKIETIGSFAQNLFSNYSGEKNQISEEASVLFLNHCFKEAGLKYFSQYKYNVPFGTLKRIKSVISEYKRQGITPKRLKEEAQKLQGSEKIKAKDIAEVYSKYERKLKKIKLIEIGDVYAELTKLSNKDFETAFKNEYPDSNLVLVNGFDEFTAPETSIINFTADINQIELFVILDYFKYNPVIFSHLDACHKRFTDFGFKEVTDLSAVTASKFISVVKENLSVKPSSKKIKSFEDSLTVIEARSREEEIELVAKQIKNILSNQKIEPSRICIVFNLIEKYSPIIRDRFPVFGIPFNLTDRFSLSTSEPVKAIIHLLEIIENDFYYKNIIRAQSNHFVKIEEVDLANLLKCSVELKIVSGYSNWLQRLSEAIEESAPEIAVINNYEEIKENYKRTENDIKNINKLLVPFRQELNPEDFSKNIVLLIHQLNFAEKILKAPDDIAERDLKALNTFIDVLNELTAMLELEFRKDFKFDLKFYLNQLRTLTAFSRFNVTEKPGYGVQITTLNEIRGLKFDYLFICGLNDGDIPSRFSPEVFFSGSFAKEENRHQIEERYLFYQALCAFNKGLFLAYPLYEEKKELVQSNFLQDFLNLFSVKKKNYISFSNTVYTKKELLEHIGGLTSESRKSIQFDVTNELNLDQINHSIEIDKKRQFDPFGSFEYSGYINKNISESTKEKLDKIVHSEFSATQLETYAKCPYKFFLKNILNVQTLEEPLEELEAFEFGTLLHNILYEFYSILSKKEITLNQCSDGDFKLASKILFDLANKKFEELNLRSELIFLEREKVLGLEGNYKNSLLFKFLEEERKNDEGYIPSFFELGFGRMKNNANQNSSLKIEVKTGNIKLKGKIDRIDVNEKNNSLKVIDYKLGGSIPTSEDLKAGLYLQLPLYLFAAKKLISAHFKKDIKPANAEIFSLRYSEEDFGRKKLRLKRSKKDEGLNDQIQSSGEMIETCLDAINNYVKEISEGKFNLSTLQNRESKVCQYCDFKKICGIQHVKY